ncbi:hypothetical protein B0O99DRAFT_640479 [Bisporella sp. PMI_857]|nr:hypothetical protein B0O99DRAFT_640479 [Bisporella sp. PMI_857]
MDSRSFPLSSKTKQQILANIFGGTADVTMISDLLEPSHSYFCYYQRSVQNTRESSLTGSHQQITSLVTLLKDCKESRSSAENILHNKLLNDEFEDGNEIIEDSLNLAARILLMVPTGGFFTNGRSITLSGETKLNWENGTIEDLASKEFIPQTQMKNPVKPEKVFNAMNLERIAGIDVRWTSNLADHLRMRDDDRALEIYHYATFLRLHQNSDILPTAMVEETLRTLALLLPEHDRSVEKWFSYQETKIQKRRKLPLDPLARECGQLKTEQRQIERFQYWHDRLVVLKQVFDEVEPSNIKQWWRDRRRHVQWYTFWVAALVLGLTVIFRLVQSIEGRLQVWYAAKSSH